jgi:cytochrome c biogenesis protein CcmG, thiol:disulfide interchange protein DsbE
MWRLLPFIVFIVLAIFMWQGLKLDPRLLRSTLVNQPVPTFTLPLLPVQGLSNAQAQDQMHTQSLAHDQVHPQTHPPMKSQLHTNTQMFNQKEFLGHVSLLNVWATWCSVCRQEHAELMDIARSHQVVITGLDYKDNARDAIRWLAELGNPYQAVVFDEAGKLAMDLGVYGTPETYLIDSKGIIRYRHVGLMTKQDWEQTLLPLIHSFK